MAEFRYLNVNPDQTSRNDCVTRAISLASGLSYADIRKKLYHTAELLDCEKLCVCCYHHLIEYVLGAIPCNCVGLTVGEFASQNQKGTFLIRIRGHLTTIIDGIIYDIWNCSGKMCDCAWKFN